MWRLTTIWAMRTLRKVSTTQGLPFSNAQLRSTRHFRLHTIIWAQPTTSLSDFQKQATYSARDWGFLPNHFTYGSIVGLLSLALTASRRQSNPSILRYVFARMTLKRDT